MITHRVENGERLSDIVARHGVPLAAMLDANRHKPRVRLGSGLEVFASLAAGEDLRVPTLGDATPTDTAASLSLQQMAADCMQRGGVWASDACKEPGGDRVFATHADCLQKGGAPDAGEDGPAAGCTIPNGVPARTGKPGGAGDPVEARVAAAATCTKGGGTYDMTTGICTAPPQESKPMWPWIVGGIVLVTGAIFVGTLAIDGSKTAVVTPSPRPSPRPKEALA
jgi:hypothetical protein